MTEGYCRRCSQFRWLRFSGFCKRCEIEEAEEFARERLGILLAEEYLERWTRAH